MRRASFTVIALMALADLACAQGQAIGPGGTPMAPGASQPRDFTPGGIGAGGVKVSPGRATRGVNVQRIGPGGTRLAPGSAGTVDSGPSLRPAPAVAPSSPRATTAIYTKRRHIHRGKHRLRRPSPNIM